MGGRLHSNVLELFKQTPWRPGVDAETAIIALREAVQAPIPRDQLIAKAFVQPSSATTGLAQYDLEQQAKLLYPVTTIFRNLIPRVTGGTGVQSNWRAVTAVNPNKTSATLSEGHRGPAMGQTTVDKTAPFRTIGLDNFVTEQAYLAGVTFEDLYALASTMTLQGLMEAEERLDIGGNSSILLGTGGTPTGTGASTGGFLSNGTTFSVIVVPLTYDGMQNSTAPTIASNGGLSGGAVALPYTRVNLDGSTDQIQGFCGIQSAASSAISLSGGTATQVINAVTAAVNGAWGYAWYLGATAGTERLVMITGYPIAKLTNTNSTGQLAASLPVADTSTNALSYDGLVTQILASGSGAYVKDLGGAALTTAGSGSGRCAEIDAALLSQYNNYRLVATDIFMNVTDMLALAAIVLTGNTNMAPFFLGGMSEQGLAASTVLKRYVNAIGFGTAVLDIHVHPFIPQGTIIFYSRSNPYPLSNVPTLLRTLCWRDYWAVDWPVVTMQKTNGVYCAKVLQCYFTPAFGVITGVKS